MKIEQLIISNLIKNKGYTKKVIPHIKSEYFLDNKYKVVFNHIKKFSDDYGNTPNSQAIRLLLDSDRTITEYETQEAFKILDDIDSDDEQYDQQWLEDESEKFCQEKALFNAIHDSIQIMDGKDNGKSTGEIPFLLSSALSVCFNNSVGHDYFDDYHNRYDFYHTVEERIPFDLKYFNKITRGGLPKKTLSIALAGTAVGKSLFMCHVSASALLNNKNVLYITLEMSEERISERIDANLLNVPIDQLETLPKEVYERKINKLLDTCKGKLIVKEYPTATANVGHFRALLNELKTKKNFVPDLICVDYLNICSSLRLKAGSNVNSYTYIKAIAEELRGLAVEFNVPIISATQTTRSGFTNTDPGLEDTSESFGLPATADFMFALISTDELHQMNQIMVKQLKNRYSDPNINKRFVIGVDKSKMRLYDTEERAQNDIVREDTTQQKPNKSKFSGLEV